eukprot:2171971-Ditylum_brightwellii.AAC.1
MELTAYALGALNGANRLDPRTVKYFPVFIEMQRLMEFATIEVRKDTQWENAMKDRPFIFCSVKLYYTYTDENGNKVNKHTNWHTDSQYKKDGTFRDDNSQELNTPVAIFTFGDKKNLWFC